MIEIKTSVIDDTKLFSVNGLEYSKGLFKIVYGGVEETNTGYDFDAITIRVDYLDNDKPLFSPSLLKNISIDDVVSTDINVVVGALNALINFNGGEVTPLTLISEDGGNALVVGTDGKLYVTATSSGATNLSYTASPTDGKVNSDSGTDATLPLADATNAGLLKPSDFSKLASITAIFTSALKTAYDGAVTWIATNGVNVISAYTWVTTNGANVLAHLSNTSNPHSTTAAQVGAQVPLVITSVKTSNYSVGLNELAPFDLSSGSLVATLPTAPADGTQVGVKIIALTGSNTLTINLGGSDVINVAGGVTTATLTVLNQAFIFQYKSGIWYAVDSSISKTYIDTKVPKTIAATGSVISFVVPQVYNTNASPSSSNLTDSLTSAQIGVVQKIYSNKSVEPTYPAGWVKVGTGNYAASALNIIFAEWVTGTRVEYWVVQPAS